MTATTDKQTELVNEYKQPVMVDISDHVNVSVGGFKLKQARNTYIEHLNPDATLDGIRQAVKRDTIVIPEEHAKTIDDATDYAYKTNDAGLAYSSRDDKNNILIVLPKYEIPGKLKKSVEKSADEGDRYLAGGSMATVSIFSHEIIHTLHDKQCSGQNDTPYMAAVYSDTTEQLANFNQYMTYAHIWKNAKQAGAQNLTIDGQTMPVDNILSFCPGLKKELTTNGFDETNPDCRERIAKIASTYWNTERATAYIPQAQKLAKASEEYNYSMMGAIVNAREWEKRQEAWVTNLKTGDGVTYSAPECLKYFLPSKERTDMILESSNVTNISNEQLLKLDKYMDKKGITTDEDKAQFIKAQMECIAYRNTDNPKYDKDFANLLIEQSPSTHKQITYADGMVAQYDKDKITISFGTESTTINKADLEKNKNMDMATVHQELQAQKGKYPPDAPTPEIEASRALNNSKMIIATNKASKTKQAEQTKATPVKQTTLTSEMMALRNRQNSM